MFAGWRNNALGVASNDNNVAIADDNELDWEHLNEIRDDLLAAGYDNVAQVYEPNDDPADVKAAIEAGLGVINYTGHGESDKWWSTKFDVDDVDALENSNQLPWIISVACVNGQFHLEGDDCFASTACHRLRGRTHRSRGHPHVDGQPVLGTADGGPGRDRRSDRGPFHPTLRQPLRRHRLHGQRLRRRG